MKKITIPLLIFILLFGHAFAEEIDVFNIPWGSNINEVIEILENKGFVIPENRIFLDCHDSPYWTYDMKRFSTDAFDNVGIKIYLFGDCVLGAQIAGYPISVLSTHFYYPIVDGTVIKQVDCARYYLTEITLKIDKSMLLSIYDDLTNKLSSLYGTYQSGTTKDSNLTFSYRAWIGSNNTQVCLFSCEDSIDGFSNTIILRYGISNSKEILQEIYSITQNSTISDPHNMDGL